MPRPGIRWSLDGRGKPKVGSLILTSPLDLVLKASLRRWLSRRPEEVEACHLTVQALVQQGLQKRYRGKEAHSACTQVPEDEAFMGVLGSGMGVEVGMKMGEDDLPGRPGKSMAADSRVKTSLSSLSRSFACPPP